MILGHFFSQKMRCPKNNRMAFYNMHTNSILKNGLSRFILVVFLCNWFNYLNLARQIDNVCDLAGLRTLCFAKAQGKDKIISGRSTYVGT